MLLRACPDDEDTIYQIVDLLVDTCSTKRKLLRVAGDDKPAEVVRSRFMKLNADHIRFVLKCLAESTAPVRNMKQYLLAALYNAPTTMQLYYQNQTKQLFSTINLGFFDGAQIQAFHCTPVHVHLLKYFRLLVGSAVDICRPFLYTVHVVVGS